jgi:hypothetical protein
MVVTEYVDQFGNPVDPPSQIQAETIVMTRSPIGEEVIVYAEPAAIYVDVPAAPVAASANPGFNSFGDDDHAEDEHEDEREDEHEDEHEDGNG